MAHFYGILKGNRQEVARRGSRESGLTTVAASWDGCVRVELYAPGDDAADHARITLEPRPQGSVGAKVVIYDGPIKDAALSVRAEAPAE
jgi:hypothetical protein